MKQSQVKSKTSSRKKDHVLLTVNRDVTFRGKSTGFEKWEFVHNALPEINFSDISTETIFLSKRISFPFMISCMTGGYADAKRINKNLAEVCEEHGVAMGVGSQRQALEDTTYHSSFSVAREAAPTIPIIGNIGAAEIAKLTDASPVQRLVDLVRADAFAVHLNPLQEFLQPEGNANFRGVLRGIEMLVRGLSIPVIVKEIGAGISKDVAQRLIGVGRHDHRCRRCRRHKLGRRGNPPEKRSARERSFLGLGNPDFRSFTASCVAQSLIAGAQPDCLRRDDQRPRSGKGFCPWRRCGRGGPSDAAKC